MKLCNADEGAATTRNTYVAATASGSGSTTGCIGCWLLAARVWPRGLPVPLSLVVAPTRTLLAGPSSSARPFPLLSCA